MKSSQIKSKVRFHTLALCIHTNVNHPKFECKVFDTDIPMHGQLLKCKLAFTYAYNIKDVQMFNMWCNYYACKMS